MDTCAERESRVETRCWMLELGCWRCILYSYCRCRAERRATDNGQRTEDNKLGFGLGVSLEEKGKKARVRVRGSCSPTGNVSRVSELGSRELGVGAGLGTGRKHASAHPSPLKSKRVRVSETDSTPKRLRLATPACSVPPTNTVRSCYWLAVAGRASGNI